MKNLLIEWLDGRRVDIRIIPFMPSGVLQDCYKSNPHKDYYDKNKFIYVASGLPHKNHINLLLAWVYLAKLGFYPELTLTIDKKHTELIAKLNYYRGEFGIKICNVGLVNHDQIFDLYKAHSALIYPSISESFGLPLLEAKLISMDIIAGELDYVRDICSPVETFNPESHISIAKAIMRYGKKNYNTPLDSNYNIQNLFDCLTENRKGSNGKNNA
jgi:glycosyltransferase involved in cell wall biosynthesis